MKTATKYVFSESNPPVLADIVVRNHDDGCKYDKIIDNRKTCRCPKYFYILPGRLRISANTDSWEVARVRGEAWVRENTPGARKVGAVTPKPIIEAFDDFIADKERSGLLAPTITKIRTIRDQLEKFVAEWNKKKKTKLIYVHELELEPLKEFFHTYADLSGTTKSKRRGYLRQFFDHCLQHGWKANTGETVPKGERQIPKDNPANFLKASGKPSEALAKLPLTDELYAALLAACDDYEKSLKSKNTAGLGKRARLFWQLMYSTGFAITDAATAQRSRLVKRADGSYAFNVNRTKTQQEVNLKVDKTFAKELFAVPAGKIEHKEYFFWSGQGAYHNAADSWWKLWAKLMTRIKPEIIERSAGRNAEGEIIMPTPHCLRYNFAENLFLAGATIAEVARLLGDTQAVVEKHYWKMSKKVQERLDSLVDEAARRRKGFEVEVIEPNHKAVAAQYAAHA